MPEEAFAEKQYNIESNNCRPEDPYEGLIEPYDTICRCDETERKLIWAYLQMEDFPIEEKKRLAQKNREYVASCEQKRKKSQSKKKLNDIRSVLMYAHSTIGPLIAFSILTVIFFILANQFESRNLLAIAELILICTVICLCVLIRSIKRGWDDKKRWMKNKKTISFSNIDAYIEQLELPDERAYLKEELKTQVAAVRKRERILQELTNDPQNAFETGWILYADFESALKNSEKHCCDALILLEYTEDQEIAAKTAEACLTSVMKYILLFDQAYEQDFAPVVNASKKENADAIESLAQASKEIND